MVAVPESSTWVPETRYARNGEVHIAYQDFGEGDLTFVGLPGIVSNIEVGWEDSEARRWLTDLASFARVVHFDKRGQGMSDRDAGVPTLDDRLGDLAAVLDAVGVDRVALGGVSEGGSTAAMFAATYPERVSHLCLYGSFAQSDVARGDAFMPRWAEGWGTPETLSVRAIVPSKVGDLDFLRWINRFERQTTTPAGLLAAWRWIRDMDLRPVLDSIQCPTLVVHRSGDRLVPVSNGRYLAEHIPGAQMVELDGDTHVPQWGDVATVLSLLEEFLTGHPSTPKQTERVLATVLFTDIVDSTASAAALGDSAWRQVLDRHDKISQSTVADCGGRLVKGTGDGVLATFDAPARGLRCADTLRSALSDAGIAIRAGVHTGEVELRGDDVAGIGVHIAARVAALAGAGELLASRTVKDLVAGSDYAFSSRGVHSLKGVPDEWELLAVT
jgi:pimeloyl-ACP methyl ester carboxylesterase